jgi:hypothetical protein
MKINETEWFDLQFNPEEALRKYGIVLPTMPNDDIQIGFTGMSGRANLQQAFDFYRYVISVCHLNKISQPRILDFGGGWGRIARFFLRDTNPENIYIAETREYAIECLLATGNPCRVIHNQPQPPILGLTEQFDLVFAYSVFSHLSEQYFRSWIDYLLGVLRPRGYLVFTSRGELFIRVLESLHKTTEEFHPNIKEHIRRLREELPLPQEIRRHYLNGEFQFYPIGGSGELTTDFWGETFIPKKYILHYFKSNFYHFREDIPNVDQSVVVLRKTAGIIHRFRAFF